jgi:hypothetical protein
MGLARRSVLDIRNESSVGGYRDRNNVGAAFRRVRTGWMALVATADTKAIGRPRTARQRRPQVALPAASP